MKMKNTGPIVGSVFLQCVNLKVDQTCNGLNLSLAF